MQPIASPVLGLFQGLPLQAFETPVMSLTSLGRTKLCVLAALLTTLVISCRTICLAEQLPIQSYTTAHGLARDYINRIKQDSRGFIWFCTNEGISRFDGYGFTNYGVDDGLPHRIVNDVLETHEGIHLFATNRGLVQFEPISADESGTRFTYVELGSSEFSNWVRSVIEDSSGAVWCGTVSGVYRLERTSNGWKPSPIHLGTSQEDFAPPVNALAFDTQG